MRFQRWRFHCTFSAWLILLKSGVPAGGADFAAAAGRPPTAGACPAVARRSLGPPEVVGQRALRPDAELLQRPVIRFDGLLGSQLVVGHGAEVLDKAQLVLGVVDLPAVEGNPAPYFFASQSMWKASKVVPAEPPRIPTTSERS